MWLRYNGATLLTQIIRFWFNFRRNLTSDSFRFDITSFFVCPNKDL